MANQLESASQLGTGLSDIPTVELFKELQRRKEIGCKPIFPASEVSLEINGETVLHKLTIEPFVVFWAK